MEYTIVELNALKCKQLTAPFEQFVLLVNEKIAQGWEPQGGVTTYTNTLVQAMIRRK